MAVLRLHGVSVAWAAQAPIFDSVSLTLDVGFYGLVGANGSGKTTLLSLLAGEREPTDGTLALAPRNSVVAYCRQVVDRRDDDVDALATRDDGVAAELRGRLRLDPNELARWETLSPGERKRWQIAAALAREPDVLLLDEPTNHLDSAGRQRLLGALRQFAGLGLIVSHDRSVLDALTTATLRVHRRSVTLWPGSFSEAKLLWERERAEQRAEHDAARQRVKVAKAQLDSARRTQLAASNNVSTGRRMKDRNDSDARGILASTKASWAAAKAGRAASTARTQLERAQKSVKIVERDPTVGGRVFATYERATTPVLFHLSEAAIKRGDHVVLRDVRVTLGREERARLEGPNGAGKTTLLEALVASTSHPERILYLPQELTLDAIAAAVVRLHSFDPEQRGRLLSLFAALGSEPERILRAEPEHLSPGEARKLILAEALSRQVWALVLDEPTNHLDLPSVERLEAALADYPGAIVLVTHDDIFAARLTTRALRVGDGTVR
jgi:ATPase subunit of ABC transporter with duplicated ATPase domains